MKQKDKIIVVALILALSASVLLGAAKPIRDRRYWSFLKLDAQLFLNTPNVVTITASSAGGAVPTVYSIQSVDKSVNQFTCGDTDGCRVYIPDVGDNGTYLEIDNVGTNAIAVNEESGVVEGAGNISLGAKDTATYRRGGGAWLQTGLSNN